MDTQRLAQRQAAWRSTAMTRGWRAWVLWPASFLYGFLVQARHSLYRWGLLTSRRLPVPVVVVGNLVVGGAGKTPTTIALVAHLRQRGWRPGVISRGHGRRADTPLHVQPDGDAALCGDEPLQIRRTSGVPVCVARRRFDAGQSLIDAHPDVNVLVCDDGLQHLALHADVRIAVFDDRGVGNGWLLPAGLLREPWPPGPVSPTPQLALLQSRSGTPAARVSMPGGVHAFHANRQLGTVAVNRSGKVRPLDSFLSGPPSAMAGIARPEVFFDMLREHGLTLQTTAALPDHAPAAQLLETLASLPGPVLCTEKDLVKLSSANGATDVWAVPLQLTIEDAFFSAVDKLLPSAPR